MRRTRENQKGFTLIELVIVVAVLAILAVVAIPTVGSIISDSNTNVDKANLALYQSAVERAYIKDGAYPTATNVVSEIKKYAKVESIGSKTSGKDFYYVAVKYSTYNQGDILYLASDPDTTGTDVVKISG